MYQCCELRVVCVLTPRTFAAGANAGLLPDFRLNQHCQLCQRFLPSEITHLYGDYVRNTFLHDAQGCASNNWLKPDGNLQDASQAGVIKYVGVAKQLARDQLQVFAAKRMALLAGEIGE